MRKWWHCRLVQSDADFLPVMNENNFARLYGFDGPIRNIISNPYPERAALRDILENGDGAIALIGGGACQHDLLILCRYLQLALAPVPRQHRQPVGGLLRRADAR